MGWCYADGHARAFSVPVPEGFPVPIGLRLNQAARAVGRAFDEALAEAGGSLPVWLILLNLKVRRPGTQRELAEAVGIREATLTHHLNAMDADGLITRTRDAANRRVQVVTLTEKGDQAFQSLAAAAVAFDAKLRTRPGRRRPGHPDHIAHSPVSQRRPPRPGTARRGAAWPTPTSRVREPEPTAAVSGTRGSGAPRRARGTAAAAGRAAR